MKKKENLIFLSKYVFNFYVKDPSNNDDKYLRIKVRKIMQEFEKNGLDKKNVDYDQKPKKVLMK